LTASCAWQIILETAVGRPPGRVRREVWLCYNSLGKKPGAFFRASLQDGGESHEAMSNRTTMTPGILPFALRASDRGSNRSWRLSPPRARAVASIHWIDGSALTLPDATPHAPWRPSNCRF